MQLKLESEPFTFDSLFNSMSGPHGQNVGFNDAVEDKQGLETMQMRHILNQKRGQEEQDQADSKKRSKFDYGVQHSQSNDNNSFHYSTNMPGSQMISDYPQQLPAGGFHQYHTGGDFNDYQGDQNFSDIFQQGTSFQAGHNAETTDLQSQFQAALAANTERAFVMQQMNASGNFFGDRDMPGLMNQGNVSQRHQQNAFDSNSEFLQQRNRSSMPDHQSMQGISQLQQQSGAFPMTAPPLLSGMMDSFAYLDNRIQPAPGFGGFGAGIQSAATASALNQMTARAVSAPQCSTGHMGQFGNLQAGMNGAQSAGLNPAGFYRRTGMNTAPPPQQSISMNSATSQDMLVPSLNSTLRQNIARLPPMEETPTPHYSQRICMPFSTDEDANWLSEFQCMIRADILELFRVSEQGIKVRNGLKSLTVSQVGIRCRYCAHLQHGTRANRASCFPSKIDKIYQSFTMMLREHFPHCPEIPPPTKKAFLKLQNMNAQGASNAKGYWEHAAKKMGLVDITGENGKGGIHISEETQRHALRISPFGSSPNFREPHPPVSLVHKSDKDLASPFLYFLLQQVYRVHLAPSERKGNRKSLRPGMPGFGCKYCYEAGRMGLCRLFPARRRTIHTKIPDLYDHMKRCPLCPNDVKERLVYLHMEDPGTSLGGQDQNSTSRGREREFFEHVWSRLGHDVEAVEE